jgi:hypothetical protein
MSLTRPPAPVVRLARRAVVAVQPRTAPPVQLERVGAAVAGTLAQHRHHSLEAVMVCSPRAFANIRGNVARFPPAGQSLECRCSGPL